MGRRVRILSALVAGTLAFVVGSSTAHALSGDRLKCQKGIAKEAGKYVNGKLKVLQKCLNANLGAPGTCAAPDAEAIAKLVSKLNAGLDKACGFADFPGTDDDNLAVIGFPGPCGDVDPLNGFNVGDLKACILESHDTIISGACGGGTNSSQSCNVLADCPDTGPGTFCRGFINTEYDSTVVLPLGSDDIKCQKEVGKAGAKFVSALMKSVQKCRNALLDCKTVTSGGIDTTVCKLSGLSPQTCAVNDPKTADAVTKARDKAIAAITKKCTVPPADLGVLKLCDPDQGTTAAAATCEADVHQDLTDNPDTSAIPDLLDYQYAQRGQCGDNRRNQPSEECDGTDDSACPGACGGASGFFPCFCQNTPRTRVVEHANADLDNGWSGQSHDSGIVEGGGYVADLWDCDGPGGPDTLCAVGPSCSLPPHSPCSPSPSAAVTGNSICAGLGQGTCRTTAAGATGPHCEKDFQKRCRPDQNDCNVLPGDRCVQQAHGAPLPLVAGGVAVCVVNTFTEDVTGTTDLATGAGAVRLRQDSATFPGGSTQQPCPVCGGFCSGPGSQDAPNTRTLCSSDADCSGGRSCVLENICSWGPDYDKPCRPNPPFGGPTQFFGNPSKDCRRAASNGPAFGVIDILFNPATTGATTRTANTACGSPAPPGFTGRTCAGGTNQHAPCTVASECPGGTCNLQCFCPFGGDTSRPNGCQAACLGGTSDAQPCTDNSECPGGFCHPADCRLNPSDTDSAQEGLCTVGPADNTCSVNTFLACETDADCSGAACPFCEPGETCVSVPRQCFVNPTILRSGTPGTPDRTTAAIFCIAATGEDAVDAVAGLPGPGAITQPATTIEVGF
jgi:hypothetical protein